MKRTWNTPELTVYGPVQEITQKVIGFGDAIIFDSSEGGGGDNDGPAGGSL
ncbi:MAG: lasso peptide [Gloeocapsa sp. UFS-A4-WI-NPMV-4B04]|nr:lasso peptide [Gloeocapsa sp. UFS-A4-WI-NPMV-4B04]